MNDKMEDTDEIVYKLPQLGILSEVFFNSGFSIIGLSIILSGLFYFDLIKDFPYQYSFLSLSIFAMILGSMGVDIASRYGSTNFFHVVGVVSVLLLSGTIVPGEMLITNKNVPYFFMWNVVIYIYLVFIMLYALLLTFYITKK